MWLLNVITLFIWLLFNTTKEQNQQGWSGWLKLLAQKGVSRFTIFRLNNDKRLLLVLFSVSSAWPNSLFTERYKVDISLQYDKRARM